MEFRFLTLEDVLELHALQIEAYGGATGIREQSLLESAVMMPQASFGGSYVHSDVFEMAAAYAFHIAENQPFVDGNKRTALDNRCLLLIKRSQGFGLTSYLLLVIERWTRFKAPNGKFS